MLYVAGLVSLSTLTTLAVVRDADRPTKRAIGRQPQDGDDQPASLTDLLVTMVPTELVAPYTAAAAGVVGAVASPSASDPHPDQLTAWRWLLFGVLLAATFGLVWLGKRLKESRGPGGSRGFPLPESAGAVVAAAGWALALPMSPLVPYLHGNAPIFVPFVVAFVAVAATSLIAAGLQRPRQVWSDHRHPDG